MTEKNPLLKIRGENCPKHYVLKLWWMSFFMFIGLLGRDIFGDNLSYLIYKWKQNVRLSLCRQNSTGFVFSFLSSHQRLLSEGFFWCSWSTQVANLELHNNFIPSLYLMHGFRTDGGSGKAETWGDTYVILSYANSTSPITVFDKILLSLLMRSWTDLASFWPLAGFKCYDKWCEVPILQMDDVHLVMSNDLGNIRVVTVDLG